MLLTSSLIYTRSAYAHTVNVIYTAYIPFYYVLLFLYGDLS